MMMTISIMIKLIRLNHGLRHLLTPIFYPSFTSQSRLRTLCTEFSDIFSNDLPKEPANIPPFNLIVDNLKWEMGKNRAPPRAQSAVKQTELFKTLQTLISQGIVEKSQSPHNSQILMVPKRIVHFVCALIIEH